VTDAGPVAADDVVLRRAVPGDVGLLFEWRNLPQIVDLSTSRRRVDWDEHRAWMTGLMADANRLLLVVLSGNEPIGQVRFEPLPARREALTVSIYLIPGQTGLGLGVHALRAASSMAFDLLPVRHIYAFIREDNGRSLRAFEKSGYGDLPADPVAPPAGHVIRVLARDRSVERGP
jgi:RimJ/RimL family protein N-acetyltransferase